MTISYLHPVSNPITPSTSSLSPSYFAEIKSDEKQTSIGPHLPALGPHCLPLCMSTHSGPWSQLSLFAACSVPPLHWTFLSAHTVSSLPSENKPVLDPTTLSNYGPIYLLLFVIKLLKNCVYIAVSVFSSPVLLNLL